MAHAAYSAQTKADTHSTNESEKFLVLADLGEKLKDPASKWTDKHLLAYQLDLGSENGVLETFAADYTASCPILHPENSTQRVNSDKMYRLFEEITPAELLAPESELLQPWGPNSNGPDPLGPFKIALAQACNAAHGHEPRIHPERERGAPERPCFVSSAEAIDGSSSPRGLSSSDFEMGESGMDDDESEERSGIQEEVAVRLLIEFCRYVLQYCLEQPNAAGVEIRPRVERWRSTASVGSVESSGQDDGGIAQFRRLDENWAVDHPYLASFEVKRAQRLQHCRQTGKLDPVMPDSTLAQILGEAFCHFKFGIDYNAYLDAMNREAQRALVRDIKKDTSVRLLRSKPFDLRTAAGRKAAARHILALLRQHQKATTAPAPAEATTSDSDDNGPMDRQRVQSPSLTWGGLENNEVEEEIWLSHFTLAIECRSVVRSFFSSG
ncbi:hypothetical protein PWT90_03425 [Aphanocladium album]|nr:hypothetical protein PWT90_03425 [Aphanocladium album]